MTEEQLFEWPVTEKRKRKPKPKVELVDRPRTYMAIATRTQGPQFHRVRFIERGTATHITWCGVKGHRVLDSTKRVPLCEACEKAVAEHAEKDGMGA